MNAPHRTHGFFTQSLSDRDPELFGSITSELGRQRDEIELIASENIVSAAVMEAQGSVMTNKYAEGYPGRRYYGGCQYVDIAENLAIDRAKELFGCGFANVQPNSGSQANQGVFQALIQPGDTILGMSLDAGGHLTHGARPNQSGKWFNAVQYGVRKEDNMLDYDQVEALAKEHQPKLIIAGGSAIPRQIDFARMREIADMVGAYLHVDMAHFAGLVAAGEHPSPFPYAHVATTTTHKTLRGPRGGMILTNDEDIAKKVNSAIFPGSQPDMFEKAAKSDVDVIFLDLEDAVAPDEKEQARKNIIEALNDIDWGNKAMSVRINGLDTHYMYRDVVDVVEQAGERLDLIMVPKVGTASDVYAVDMLVTQIEDAKGYKKRIGFEHIIETALGMQNVSEIAAASKRNESLHFGVADYAASTRARTTIIGGVNPDYSVLTDADADGGRMTHWGDMWHYALARMVVAARANGLRPIDGPFGDFQDPDGYRAAAKRAAVLGCEGKWAIHPSQIVLANEVMSPSDAEVTKAQRILVAMSEAESAGKGAVSLDGRLIDYASIRQAEVLVEKASQIAAA